MKRFAKRIMSLTLAMFMMLNMFSINAYGKTDLGAISKQKQNYMISLGTPNVGSIGGEWLILGLARSGYGLSKEYVDGYYKKVEEFVKQNVDSNERLHKNKSTENARIILALTAIGKDVKNVAGHNLLLGLNDLSYLKKQGINGPIWALIAFDSKNYDIPANSNPANNVTRDILIDTIVSAQNPDGTWGLSTGSVDIDITAMAITSLAPYYKNNNVKTAIDKALVSLQTLKTEAKNTSETLSQIIVALCAIGVNPVTDNRFFYGNDSIIDELCKYSVENKGFKHIHSQTNTDGMASEQGYYALVAYDRFINKKPSLFDMSDVTIKSDNANITNPTNPTNTITAAGQKTEVYRLYNPATSEHLYTTSLNEYNYLGERGWNKENIAWYGQDEKGIAVTRLLNSSTGDHHYTTSKTEIDFQLNNGWKFDGICFYSSSLDRIDAAPVYRLYNPNLKVGSHHYTTDENEKNICIKNGWKDEGIAFYAIN